MAATAKTIVLKGDPKKPESAEHIIEFPGGSISVCRTSENEYWAHVHVNRELVPASDAIVSTRTGVIKAIRVDTPDGVKTVDHHDTNHFAVLIGMDSPVAKKKSKS